MIIATVVVPLAFSHDIRILCEKKRGLQISENIMNNRKVVLKYKMPLSEVIVDFVDKLKSMTHGYGSFDYELAGFERTNVVKMVIYIMNDPVDALTFLVHKDRAYNFGKQICKKVKETIDPHLFTVSIQARIGTKTIAAETIPHIKKHVTAKCYGGDYSRKRKLLERYKEGKKKLKALGKIQVSKETFLHVMKND
jgi:GTP-binding protein LepA